MWAHTAGGYHNQGSHAQCCRYLEDLNTVLVPELMPDLAVKLDNDAVPGKGRRADEVGEFYLMHRSAFHQNPDYVQQSL